MYKCKTLFWSTGKNSKLSENVSSIVFENKGDVKAYINGTYPLEPGESTPTIGTAHPDAVDETIYEVSFDPNSVGVAPLVTAIYTKVYTKKNSNGSANCEIL